jgi:hypothetical protein
MVQETGVKGLREVAPGERALATGVGDDGAGLTALERSAGIPVSDVPA